MDYSKWKNYKATKKDLDAVVLGIEMTFSPEMDFVFRDKEYLKKIIFLSYDFENLYIFQRERKKVHLLTFSYKPPVDPFYYRGMRAFLLPKELIKYVPIEFRNFKIISGGLLTPSIEIQKRYGSIYNSYESYISQIPHEYAHIYFNRQLPWYLGNKEENLMYLRKALSLFKEKEEISDINVKIPSYISLSETFAFCTEYYFAGKFYPGYKKDIDKSAIKIISKNLAKEEKIDMTLEDSNLKDSHFYSFVIGKIVYEKYKDSWPEVLLGLGISI